MPEPTLAQLLDDLVELLAEATEYLKREYGDAVLQKLKDNSDMKDFETTVLLPPRSNENTTESGLAMLSVAQLDEWAEQNKAEAERLLSLEM